MTTAAIARLIVLESTRSRASSRWRRVASHARSRRLFTLSAIYGRPRRCSGRQNGSSPRRTELARAFWSGLRRSVPRVGGGARGQAHRRRGPRRLHPHDVVGAARLRLAGYLLADELAGASADSWAQDCGNLREIDWSRSNRELWEGRAMIGGKVAKSHQNVVLTTNVILQGARCAAARRAREGRGALQAGRRDNG